MGTIRFDAQSPSDFESFEGFPLVHETRVDVTANDACEMILKVVVPDNPRPTRSSVPIRMNWQIAMQLVDQLGAANRRASALRAEQRGGGETA
jgi:hypothetical protein